MQSETNIIEQESERALYGKLIGVIQNRYQLKAICDALTTLEVREVDVLEGLPGIAQLEKWSDEVSNYFFGDMEGKMLERYLDAARKDLIVFSAVVESGIASGAARIAKNSEA